MIDFNFENIATVELGFGFDDQPRSFVQIPVDEEVQTALGEMAKVTVGAMEAVTDAPETYQPSEKYAAPEHLTLSLNDGMVSELKNLHEAANLPEEPNALDRMDACFAYFAKLTDSKGQHLTAMRRSTQFKTLIKKRNRLIRCVDNTLKTLDETVFKLDNDFDFLIHGEVIHILRPSGFEFTAQLQEAIMNAVPQNITAISAELDYVDFESIQAYAQKHPRAARYLASIKSKREAEGLAKSKLEELCRRTRVDFSEDDGNIQVEDSQVMGFLEVLDRRRYEIDLKEESDPEVYRAPSRSRISESS